MDKRKNNANKIHSIHAIKQNIIRKDFGDNNSLTKVINVLLESMPSTIGKTTAYIEENPLMLDNMKIVSQHIIKRKLINSISIEFMIKLIRIYTSTYQYDNAKEVIDFILFNVKDNKLKEIVSKDDVIFLKF